MQLGKAESKETGKAEQYYRLAADQGLAVAQYNLAVLRAEEALEWFRKAADQAFSPQRDLGLCFERGIYTDKDDTAALKWYRIAAEHGDALAQLRLARILHHSENREEASRWSSKADGQGVGVTTDPFDGKFHPLVFGLVCIVVLLSCCLALLISRVFFAFRTQRIPTKTKVMRFIFDKSNNLCIRTLSYGRMCELARQKTVQGQAISSGFTLVLQGVKQTREIKPTHLFVLHVGD